MSTSQQTYQNTAYTTSAFTESTADSHPKMDSEPRSEVKGKGTWCQRIKRSLKEVGYPPTYHYDVQHGKTRPEYGIFGESIFTDKKISRS
jgi:hypothetical protein